MTVVLEFVSRDIYLLFAILLSSKFQNSIFYQHMRPKSGLKFPRPFSQEMVCTDLQKRFYDAALIPCLIVVSGF